MCTRLNVRTDAPAVNSVWVVRRLSGSIRESPGQYLFELISLPLLVHLEVSADSSSGPGPKLESVEISKCTSSEGGDLFCPGALLFPPDDPHNGSTTPHH